MKPKPQVLHPTNYTVWHSALVPERRDLRIQCTVVNAGRRAVQEVVQLHPALHDFLYHDECRRSSRRSSSSSSSSRRRRRRMWK